MVNIFGVILLNTLYICYNLYKRSEKDDQIRELQSKVFYLENELLKRNEFIANELQKEFANTNEKEFTIDNNVSEIGEIIEN